MASPVEDRAQGPQPPDSDFLLSDHNAHGAPFPSEGRQRDFLSVLDDPIELLRCHYNFIRPPRSLKFGREIRTPAMQAGLTSTGLSFRDIFSSGFVVLSSTTQVARVFAFRRD